METQLKAKIENNKEIYKLGPRMLSSVINRLEETLDHYRYSSPYLDKISEQLSEVFDQADEMPITLTEIAAILEKHTNHCHLVAKMHENFVRDFYMRSKHFRKWRGEVLYLSDHLVNSSVCSQVS
ncbi:MAG: hypothetical protein EOO10_14125 [Chitinophagaceae bacterium]|nr:MAG: hypothetical protein EOO10_14125 [Chitinophagaceae bacterium]